MRHRANIKLSEAHGNGQKVGPTLTDASRRVERQERRNMRLLWGVLVGLFALASYLVYVFAGSLEPMK